MKPRLDLLDDRSPAGVECFQLNPDDGLRWSHVYMEAQIFTPDSKRLVIHRSSDAHLFDREDPRRAYVLCDIENRGALTPLTDEIGAIGPALSPDGSVLYYFDDETRVGGGGGRITLKRVNTDGTGRETLVVLDGPLPDTVDFLSRPYSLSTISSDGDRIAISGFLGDGTSERADYGVVVFDIPTATAALVLRGTELCNVHPQYCRSLDPEAAHDILVQENHYSITNAQGVVTKLGGQPLGCDIHVIRDDGTRHRNMPWGRDVNEHCQGHQCWRGRSTRGITSTVEMNTGCARLIEGEAYPFEGHIGMHAPGVRRNDLTAEIPEPRFFHFATDIEGRRLISDAFIAEGVTEIHLFDLPEPPFSGPAPVHYLLNTQGVLEKDTHPHPFLSPDARLGFFNSNKDGRNNAFMLTGLENVV